MKNIAFLGLGAMGKRMVKNLVAAEYRVTVWNRSAEAADELVKIGAQLAPSPKAAAEDADYVISMVRDDQASRHIWLDKNAGALANIASNTIAIESSTLSLRWTKELAKNFRNRGISFLDAPVVGSRPQAEAAQLIYLVGGDESILERARPVLDTLGSIIQHTGITGSGMAVKLAVNTLFSVQLATLAELMAYLRSAEVDLKIAIETIGALPVCSPAAHIAANAMLTENFAPMFPIELVVKDLDCIAESIETPSARLPLATTARDIFALAIGRGYGKDNITGVTQIYSEPPSDQ